MRCVNTLWTSHSLLSWKDRQMIREVDWRSCEPINANDENEFLNRVAHHLYRRFGRALKSLEVGSYRGCSAALLAQYGVVFCLDLWADLFDCEANYDQIGKVNYMEFMDNMVRLKLMNDCVFPSIASSKILNYMPPMEFDLIYIDANHDYAPVKQDISITERH